MSTTAVDVVKLEVFKRNITSLVVWKARLTIGMSHRQAASVVLNKCTTTHYGGLLAKRAYKVQAITGAVTAQS